MPFFYHQICLPDEADKRNITKVVSAIFEVVGVYISTRSLAQEH